jgi:hypothetical protein
MKGLYRHSCDIATDLPPHNPDSSFPIGNKLYGFKRNTNILLVFKVHVTIEGNLHKESK